MQNGDEHLGGEGYHVIHGTDDITDSRH